MNCEQLSGTIERIVFQNPESGYSVLKVKALNRRKLITLIAHHPSLAPGEVIQAEGVWTTDPRFGERFEAQKLNHSKPAFESGIEKYLGSGLMKGIGPVFASRMVETFGLQTLEVIESAPQLLLDVPGIGPSRLRIILETWSRQNAIRELMSFLNSHRLNAARAVRVFKTLGPNALERIKENPYVLASEIPGFGFKSSDLLAKHLGISLQSSARIRAGITHQLQARRSEGSCGYLYEQICTDTALELMLPKIEVVEQLEALIHEKKLVLVETAGQKHVFHSTLVALEEDLAKRLLQHLALPTLRDRFNLNISACDNFLSKEQMEALSCAVNSQVSIITGGPGTGKTTLVKRLAEILTEHGVRFQLAAPTGRAAKRLMESSGYSASTLHRLLGYDFDSTEFLFNENRNLPIDVLLVDETSMLDLAMASSVLKAVDPCCTLIFIGDDNQIPSVGAGKVLADMISSQRFSHAHLTHIYRQARQSQIVLNAHLVNHGSMPCLSNPPGTDFYFIKSSRPEPAISTITELVCNRIPERFGFNPNSDIQVLCPMNKGPLGSIQLNRHLQKTLNPNQGQFVERFGVRYSVGDRVIVTLNDYEKDLFNGDTGTVSAIDNDSESICINVNARSVSLSFFELDILALAYALSIHKAQGSEYPVVIIPLLKDDQIMLNRRLLYTAITRAKNMVVVVGEPSAIAHAIQNKNLKPRYTTLASQLQEA